MNRQHRKFLILLLAKKWIDIRRKEEKNLKRLQLIYFNSFSKHEKIEIGIHYVDEEKTAAKDLGI